MFEDVKIYSSPDKGVIEKFIVEWWAKWYYKTDFKTNIIYTSFQFSWANQIMYTVVMWKYRDEPIENVPLLYNNDVKDASEWITTMAESEVKNEGDNEMLWKGDWGNRKYSKTKKVTE